MFVHVKNLGIKRLFAFSAYTVVDFARLHIVSKGFVYFPVVKTIFSVISLLQQLSDLVFRIPQGSGDKISW
jgi:hypothetical protein